MRETTPDQLAKNYAPAVPSRLSRFPSREQMAIASWLIQTPVGTNYALQILEQLADLAKREEQAASKLLFQILGEIASDQLQPKELGRRLRDELARRLHPKSQAHQERFLNWVERLQLPRGVQVKPPQNFEGRSYILALQFSSPEELRNLLEEVKLSLAKSEWSEIKDF